MENKNHTLSCYKYLIKVYNLNQKIVEINDGRINPTVKLPPIILIIIFSIMTGLHSFNAMEEAIKDGDFDKFFNNVRLPVADTIVYALLAISLKGLREFSAYIV
jgi:hypothetical protein